MNEEYENRLKANGENLQFDTKEKQSVRSLLRERFLRAITGVVGKECSFHMYSNTSVEGIFRGSDIEFENLLAERLKTPFAEIPHSKIRASDVRYIVFNDFDKKAS